MLVAEALFLFLGRSWPRHDKTQALLTLPPPPPPPLKSVILGKHVVVVVVDVGVWLSRQIYNDTALRLLMVMLMSMSMIFVVAVRRI